MQEKEKKRMCDKISRKVNREIKINHIEQNSQSYIYVKKRKTNKSTRMMITQLKHRMTDCDFFFSFKK